jgi:hypothetical protein
VPQNQRRGCQRLEEIAKLNREDRLRGRQRNKIDFRLEHHAKRAFRSDHQLRKVERAVGADELVEVVAANPPQHFGKPAVDFFGVFPGKATDHLVAHGFKPFTSAFAVELAA